MSNYLSKLGSTTYDYMYLYNNILVGIDWALKDKRIRKDKELVKELREYSEIVKLYGLPWRINDLRDDEVKVALEIKKKAYQRIREVLG